MLDFASILACVERAAAERAAWPPVAARFRARLGGTGAPVVQGVGDSFAAYAAHASHAAAEAAPLPGAEALRHAIAQAGRDPDSLRALRRLAARALHPDRGGDGRALAECNAAIDAALRISRRRT